MKNDKAKNNRFFPSSLRFISSCIKTVSTNVRSAGASVAASISGDSYDHKDQVLWASFDRIDLGLSLTRVLLLGYSNGFQVLDVEDASSVSELVSKRDDPVTFLQMQPIPEKSEGHEGFRSSHPLLLVVAGDETKSVGPLHNVKDGPVRDGYADHHVGSFLSPTAVRFYSLRSHNYVHILRFRSTIYMVRCSPRVVAVGLSTQICCFDALTLENKFSVLTYPVPQLGVQGIIGVNIGYGPMAVGPRWLAYASNNSLISNTCRLSPQSLTPSPGVSPSTSPGNGTLVARYAMESSKHLATGLINLGDAGYKTLYKYCQDFLPDGSSPPVSSNASWKVTKVGSHSSESDTAGMVVIKDFVSKAVISQFRAHTSPISALCFDPSGTLLVTASVHGNNINIFRIMPSCPQNGSSAQCYNWSCSHVHLYKLHRGMTPAVIQDICFSHYSQWVGIVSSRGTCHIFVLSPFGGETGLQIQNSLDGPTLLPISSLPWWSMPSFMTNQQCFPPSQPPPPPITLSVISRIKNGYSGWLNTVSHAASSAAGKVSVPSGAVAAVFHRCVDRDVIPHHHFKANNALEHLLVYAPSGHVIQYELVPSTGAEPSETTAMQDEDLRVRGSAIQCWDVCRRTDWGEREECVSGTDLAKEGLVEMVMDTSDCEDGGTRGKDPTKPHDRSHWYISNAEVQMNSGRVPVWQKSKIYFHTMTSLQSGEQHFAEDQTGGEIEIEKIPAQEVEIRQKDLLPVFDSFQRMQSNCSGREHSTSSNEAHEAKEISSENNFVSHKKFLLPGSVDNLEGSSGTTEFSNCKLLVENGCIIDGSASLSGRGVAAQEVRSSNSTGTSEASNISSNRSDSSMNILDHDGPEHVDLPDSLDFGQYFQEGYCKASTLNECHESMGVVTDVDSNSSPGNQEKSEEERDVDDMVGCVFAFSEG